MKGNGITGIQKIKADPQIGAEGIDHHPHPLHIDLTQGGDGIHGIEQKMRLNLGLEVCPLQS
ncbi:hypothetical protein D3C71_2129560 [compost metagenome]